MDDVRGGIERGEKGDGDAQTYRLNIAELAWNLTSAWRIISPQSVSGQASLSQVTTSSCEDIHVFRQLLHVLPSCLQVEVILCEGKRVITLVSLPHTTHSVVRLRLTFVEGDWVELVLVIWDVAMEVVEMEGVLVEDTFGGVMFVWSVAAVDGTGDGSEVDVGDVFVRVELEVMS